MLKWLLIGSVMLMATGSASASDKILKPPLPIDGLAKEITAAIKAGKVALPSIELDNCEKPLWYKCHYRLGHTVEIVVSGPDQRKPATAIWVIVSDERDSRTIDLLVDLFMTRFDKFSADQRANLLESAAADLAAGKRKVEIEGKRAIITLERSGVDVLYIMVGAR